MRRNQVAPDDGGKPVSWGQLKTMARDRKFETVDPSATAPSDAKGVRAKMYTPDKQKRSDDWQRTPKVHTKTGYLSSSSDEGGPAKGGADDSDEDPLDGAGACGTKRTWGV